MKNATQTVTLENYLPDESLIWSRLMKVSSATDSAICSYFGIFFDYLTNQICIGFCKGRSRDDFFLNYFCDTSII